MRVSMLRLWISAGFALLAIQTGLSLFVLVRNRTETGEIRAQLAAVEKENDELRKEIRSVQRETSRRSPPRFEPPPVEPPLKPVVAGVVIDPAGLIRKYREAVLQSERREEQEAASKLLEAGAAAVPALMTAIGTESAVTVKAAFYALLGQFQSREALAFLQRALLAERERVVRMEIAGALGRLDDPASLNVIQMAYRDETDPEVRLGLLRTAAHIGGEASGQMFLDAMKRAPDGERLQVLLIASEMPAPSLKTVFQGILNESRDGSERILAVRGLGNIKDVESLGLLESIRTSDADESVRLEAEQAIFKIRGR